MSVEIQEYFTPSLDGGNEFIILKECLVLVKRMCELFNVVDLQYITCYYLISFIKRIGGMKSYKQESLQSYLLSLMLCAIDFSIKTRNDEDMEIYKRIPSILQDLNLMDHCFWKDYIHTEVNMQMAFGFGYFLSESLPDIFKDSPKLLGNKKFLDDVFGNPHFVLFDLDDLKKTISILTHKTKVESVEMSKSLVICLNYWDKYIKRIKCLE